MNQPFHHPLIDRNVTPPSDAGAHGKAPGKGVRWGEAPDEPDVEVAYPRRLARTLLLRPLGCGGHVAPPAARVHAWLALILLGAPLVVAAADPFTPRSLAPGVTQVGVLSAPAIQESSGLAASRKFPGTFWTHNDKGNKPMLFAISRDGGLLSSFAVTGKSLADWEDIAVDDAGNLYVADTGNNEGQRSKVAVHRFPEPDPAFKSASVRIEQTWELAFAGDPFDSESMFVHQDFGYLISKVTQDRAAEIYRFSLKSQALAVLELVARLPVTSPVAGADMSRDGAILGLVCKSGAFAFRVDGDPARAGTVNPARIKYKFDGIEGCAFVPEGLLATAESREILLFQDPAFRPPKP